MAMDASELGRWTRFAVKGGIRKCTAQQDCIAEHQEDLMLMKDDEILVLMQISGYVDLFLVATARVSEGTSTDAPPVPTPAERPSLESNREWKSSKGKIPSRLADSTTQADVEATADADEEASSPLSKMHKNRPAPLTFRKEPEPSPLLHATFGSPPVCNVGVVCFSDARGLPDERWSSNEQPAAPRG